LSHYLSLLTNQVGIVFRSFYTDKNKQMHFLKNYIYHTAHSNTVYYIGSAMYTFLKPYTLPDSNPRSLGCC
jgi:hypothetical protein